jgi:hypothetical protein
MDILLIMVRVMGERGMEQPVDYEVMDTQQCVLHGSVLHTLLRDAEAINPFDMDEGGRKEQVGGTKGQCCTPPRRSGRKVCGVYGLLDLCADGVSACRLVLCIFTRAAPMPHHICSGHDYVLGSPKRRHMRKHARSLQHSSLF